MKQYSLAVHDDGSGIDLCDGEVAVVCDGKIVEVFDNFEQAEELLAQKQGTKE